MARRKKSQVHKVYAIDWLDATGATHTGKTRVSKRLDDIVPPEVTKRFMDLNKNLWTSFTKRPDRYKTEEEWLTKVLMEHPGAKAGDDQWTAYRTASGVFFGEGKE